MRRRLAAIVLAVTAMVTIAFLLPLATVVRIVAADRATSAAEQEARTLAGVLAAVNDESSVDSVLSQLNAGSPRRAAVYLPDGRSMGATLEVPESELTLVRTGRAFTASDGAGRRVWVPVRSESGQVTAGVVFVPSSELRSGVVGAWALLVGVGLVVLAVGVVLADRLARSTVRSIEDLGHVTERLRAGDLEARVAPGGPPEVAEVGRAVNLLAGRIDELLAAEREAAADLGHRLRTPLTALSLEADGLRSRAERARFRAAVEDLAAEVTNVLAEARRSRVPSAPATCDLVAVVAARSAFWAVLADDQERPFARALPEGELPVRVAGDDLAAALDALLSNAFAHTPDGTALRIEVLAAPSSALLVVEDDGPGLPSADVLERGASGAGSSGLGLDIVRRTAERAGGSVSFGSSAAGGARFALTFPLATVQPTTADA